MPAPPLEAEAEAADADRHALADAARGDRDGHHQHRLGACVARRQQQLRIDGAGRPRPGSWSARRPVSRPARRPRSRSGRGTAGPRDRLERVAGDEDARAAQRARAQLRVAPLGVELGRGAAGERHERGGEAASAGRSCSRESCHCSLRTKSSYRRRHASSSEGLASVRGPSDPRRQSTGVSLATAEREPLHAVAAEVDLRARVVAAAFDRDDRRLRRTWCGTRPGPGAQAVATAPWERSPARRSAARRGRCRRSSAAPEPRAHAWLVVAREARAEAPGCAA